ncbi:MAG: Stp1/IreP family PP2C-type Ser/Thr phosphatase, partial [Bdellovibrionales bacterium]|nr:Stp1/IreP family PP2C-type Ser/Thr phosphatase [Bdellovibrionales bacterium]
MDHSSPSLETNPLESISFGVGTDVGRRREENQDAYGIIEGDRFRFFIVADGMGGAKGGAIASSLAISVTKSKLDLSGDLEVSNIVSAVQDANTAIFERGAGDESLAGMGTTFVGIAFCGTSMMVVNIGDSRAYRIGAEKIRQLTSDHTLVRELMLTGAISAEQAENHPVAHMLTRSLGPTPEIAVDCDRCPDGPARGDRYLLCSDGLYNLVTDDEILDHVQEYGIDDAVQKLINLANERGGTDNITVIVLHVGDNFPLGIGDFPEDLQDSTDMFSGVYESTAAFEPSEGDDPDYQSNDSYDSGVNGVNRDHVKVDRSSSHSESKSAHRLETEILERDSDFEDPRKPSRWSKVSRWTIPVVVGIAIGALLQHNFGGPAMQERQSVLTNPLASRVAKTEIELPRLFEGFPAPELVAPDLQQGTDPIGIGDGADTNVNSSGGQNLFPMQTANQDDLDARRAAIEQKLQDLEDKIAALSGPLSGNFVNRSKEANREVSELAEKAEALRKEQDRENRRLSIWYGRKKRLESTDAVDMAS